jgi:16S rRNA (cytosine1402-N4)-methyltransferase
MAHIPVLLQEVLKVLDPKPGEKFADGTLGAGGHAREIVARIAPGGTLIAVDRDSRAATVARQTVTSDSVQINIEPASYAKLPELMKQYGIAQLDGLLLDLGFSSEQIVGGTLSGRGFSFNSDEPLLMTYDDATKPVAELLAELSEGDLAAIIREYGEERYAEAIAKSILHKAKSEGIATTGKLVEAIKAAVPASYEQGRINPATRTFQALRIYANNELGQLEQLLSALPAIMAPGGRVAVISFHSLEDRIVKQHFQMYARNRGGRSVGGARGAPAGELPNTSSASRDARLDSTREVTARQAELITKKPMTASEQEIAENPRSRSAKLRGIRFV